MLCSQFEIFHFRKKKKTIVLAVLQPFFFVCLFRTFWDCYFTLNTNEEASNPSFIYPVVTAFPRKT